MTTKRSFLAATAAYSNLSGKFINSKTSRTSSFGPHSLHNVTIFKMNKRLFSNKMLSKTIAKSKMHQKHRLNVLHQIKKKAKEKNMRMINRRNEILL